MHSELSAALEAHRYSETVGHKTKASKVLKIKDTDDYRAAFLIEIADTLEDGIASAVIKLLDICGHRGIDIESHVEAKIRYNKTRPYKHGKEY